MRTVSFCRNEIILLSKYIIQQLSYGNLPVVRITRWLFPLEANNGVSFVLASRDNLVILLRVFGRKSVASRRSVTVLRECNSINSLSMQKKLTEICGCPFVSIQTMTISEPVIAPLDEKPNPTHPFVLAWTSNSMSSMPVAPTFQYKKYLSVESNTMWWVKPSSKWWLSVSICQMLQTLKLTKITQSQ